MIIRLALAVFAASVVALIYWAGGGEWERGHDLGFALAIIVFAALMGSTFPVFDRDGK